MYNNGVQQNSSLDDQNFPRMSPYPLVSPQQSWTTANRNRNTNTIHNTMSDNYNPLFLVNSPHLLEPCFQTENRLAEISNNNLGLYSTNFENAATLSSPLSGQRINNFDQLMLASPNIATANSFGNVNHLSCAHEASLQIPTVNDTNAMLQRQYNQRTASMANGTIPYDYSAIYSPLAPINSISQKSVNNVQQTNHIGKTLSINCSDFDTSQFGNNSTRNQIQQQTESPSRISLHVSRSSSVVQAPTFVPNISATQNAGNTVQQTNLAAIGRSHSLGVNNSLAFANNTVRNQTQHQMQRPSSEGFEITRRSSVFQAPMLIPNRSTSQTSLNNSQETNFGAMGLSHNLDLNSAFQVASNSVQNQNLTQFEKSSSVNLKSLRTPSAAKTISIQSSSNSREPIKSTTVELASNSPATISQKCLPKQISDDSDSDTSESSSITKRCFQSIKTGHTTNRRKKIHNYSLLSHSDLQLWWPGSSKNFTIDNNGKLYILQEYTPVLVEIKDVSGESDVLEKLSFTQWNDVCHRYKTLDEIKDDQTAYDQQNPITYHCGYCGFGFRYLNEYNNGYNAVLQHMNGSDDQNVISHCRVFLQILRKNGNSNRNLSMKTPILASRFDSKTFQTATLRSLLKNPRENPIEAKKAKISREKNKPKGKHPRK